MADVVNRGTFAGDEGAGVDNLYTGFGKINTEFAKDFGATKVHVATEKTTPVDADEFGYADSADTFKLKRFSWSAIKIALKAYFDTVYSVLTIGTTSTTAARGDYGNTAYTHSQAAHAPPGAQANADITKAEIEAKLTGELTSHSHSKLVSITAPTASFTLALTDVDKYIKATSSSAIVITVPPYSGVAFPVGTVITINQDGTGAVSVTQGSGVTLKYFKGLKVAGRYASLQIIKVATDTWDVIGGIA